ncbi:hypothetical protein V8B55DRAFT_1455517 [Mucor lusitanicus]|uniref:Uncharacterized protein n=1 Tax=Mucor circinelloides f. lusitanicus TaxID=29924 RepID=A0A8H4BRT7_MUCCL|nr:hypothetical protein FB192DRAFT_1349745 [Mucor lusitanicus]
MAWIWILPHEWLRFTFLFLFFILFLRLKCSFIEIRQLLRANALLLATSSSTACAVDRFYRANANISNSTLSNTISKQIPDWL